MVYYINFLSKFWKLAIGGGAISFDNMQSAMVTPARTALGVRTESPRQSPRLLSMAPFAPDAANQSLLERQGYKLLQASRSEVKEVGGTVSLGENAGKQTFLELVQRHTQLHLATHAQASPRPSESYIAFFPSSNNHRLYAYEIAQLNLSHLQLAILSTCRSGDGPVHESEGLLSLARAFAQAGCPAVLTALWEANDQSTAELSRLFYKQLRQGLSVDVALQQAKLAFLEREGTDGNFAPPFYWAHLVLLGQSTPTYPPSQLLRADSWTGRLALLLGLLGVGLIGKWVTEQVFASGFAIAPANGPDPESDK